MYLLLNKNNIDFTIGDILNSNFNITSSIKNYILPGTTKSYINDLLLTNHNIIFDKRSDVYSKIINTKIRKMKLYDSEVITHNKIEHFITLNDMNKKDHKYIIYGFIYSKTFLNTNYPILICGKLKYNFWNKCIGLNKYA